MTNEHSSVFYEDCSRREYITVTLNITIEDGDRFTTGFNVLLVMLVDKSIQQIVDDYYVGSDYTFHNEISRKIVKVEILEIKK
jgi:hypothetical protein